MKRYRLMTKAEFIVKYGSINNIPSPGWFYKMNEYFGIEVDINKIGLGNNFQLGHFLFLFDWLVEIDDKPVSPIRCVDVGLPNPTKLKLIKNVIIKLDQNK